MKHWLLATVWVFASNPVFAETEQEAIAALKAELAALSERLVRLEQGNRVRRQDYAIPPIANQPTSSWADRIRLEGDFRYRHDAIDAEFASERHRQRIRARSAIIADVSDTIEVGLGLASGGDDPVSANQTLGNGSSSKGVRLDLAYATWSTPVEGLKVTGGKFKNPFYRAGGNGLIWDTDLRPEGGSLSYNRGALTINGAALWADESSSDDDSFIVGSQMIWQQPVGDSHLVAGFGYYNFVDFKGEPALFDGNPKGNSVDLDGNYINGYEELEVFAELTLNIGDQPLTLFAEYVRNLEADAFDTGYSIGGKMRFKRGTHPWQLEYLYQELEADAVLGTLTDSDFIGGGTDGTGHIIKGSYDLTSRISLKGTLFINKRGGDLGIEEDYDRLMLDISFKY